MILGFVHSWPWWENPRHWKCSNDPTVVLMQHGLQPEAVRAQLEHMWDAKQRKLMCSGWRVTLQVMMKNACYSIDWSGLFRMRSNFTCWNEYERIKTTLFLHVPQLDINSLILFLPCVKKMWFLAKLAKNFALELKTQLSGESKHEQ